MAVKVREVGGVWRVVLDRKGQRVSRNAGKGRPGKRAAEAAAEQISATLILRDLLTVLGRL